MTELTDDQVKALLDGATPGPWRSDDVAVRLEDKSLVALVYGNGRGSFMANNRLIAAAPDLARALLDARAELARVRADAALAQTPTDPGDGWTWNERLGWIGPDGKPADPRRRG